MSRTIWTDGWKEGGTDGHTYVHIERKRDRHYCPPFSELRVILLFYFFFWVLFIKQKLWFFFNKRKQLQNKFL